MLVEQKRLQKWIVIWLIISMIIVFWDVMFVLLRPVSLPGGSLAWLWVPYATYIKIDTSYADLNNAFIVAQGIMSLIEIIIAIIALSLNYSGKFLPACLFAFSSMLLTGTKTVLIFVLEAVNKFSHVGHNTVMDLIFYYTLPNSIWIVIPFLAVNVLGRTLIQSRG